ncbi:MAG: dTDP-4-dehydrorhamnose 3,5-epimerase [Actinomycetes bacterium]
MRVTELDVAGALLLDLEPFVDERGSFARAFCARELADAGAPFEVAQANLSENPRAGTLRGVHLQRAPHEEAKLVRCVRGALFDVVVDLRPDSPTFGRWAGEELSADNGRALLVPEGCGHAFLTLADDTLAFYLVSEPYTPGAELGLRFDDPALGIDWPRDVAVISEKDASWPLVGEPGAAVEGLPT